MLFWKEIKLMSPGQCCQIGSIGHFWYSKSHELQLPTSDCTVTFSLCTRTYNVLPCLFLHMHLPDRKSVVCSAISKNTIQKTGMSQCITVVFHKYLKIVWYFVAFWGTGLEFSYLFAAAKTPVWLLAVWENIPICHHLGKAWNAGWGLEPIDFIDTLSSKYFSHKHEVASHVLFFPSPSPSPPIQTLATGQWKEKLK